MGYYLSILNRKREEITGFGNIELPKKYYYRLQGEHKSAREIAFFIKHLKMKYDKNGNTEWVKSKLKSLCKKGNFISIV